MEQITPGSELTPSCGVWHQTQETYNRNPQLAQEHLWILLDSEQSGQVVGSYYTFIGQTKFLIG